MFKSWLATGAMVLAAVLFMSGIWSVSSDLAIALSPHCEVGDHKVLKLYDGDLYLDVYEDGSGSCDVELDGTMYLTADEVTTVTTVTAGSWSPAGSWVDAAAVVRDSPVRFVGGWMRQFLVILAGVAIGLLVLGMWLSWGEAYDDD